MSLIYHNDLALWEKFYCELISIALDNGNEISSEKRLDYIALVRSQYEEILKSGDFRELDNIEIITFTYAVCIALSIKTRVLNAKYNELLGRTGFDISLSQVLALATIFLSADEINVGKLLDKESILYRYLIKIKAGCDDKSIFDTEVVLASDIAASLMGLPYPLAEADFAVKEYGKDFAGPLIFGQTALDDLIRIYANMSFDNERGIVFIDGEEGVGKTFITRRMAASRNQSLFVLEEALIENLDISDINAIINRISAKTYFEGGILMIRFSNKDTANISIQKLMLTMILQTIKQVVVTGSSSLLDELLKTENVHIIKKAAPDRSVQKKFFEYFALEYQVSFDDELDLNEIVSLYNLTPDRIKKAICCAHAMAEFKDDIYYVNPSGLKNEIRKLCTVKFDKLATKLESSFTFDDIELSDIAASRIKEAMNRIRFKSLVNEEYGFERSLPYGRGLTIALYGPPGTGKTMAANVIANELGMDIYRIDLSQISSKYIGESEKNLSAVFDAAKYSNAILFFDEADALFSKRTDVSNSNDKHANTETAFLLQKMEEYTGICILATNVMVNFDAAFKRRITYLIPIEMLSEEMRYKLWLKVFPKDTPLEDNLYFDHYAHLAELSGSGIKSAALSAAYKAAARGDKVSHMDICEAIDEEYKKAGHTSILPALMSLSSY